MAIQISKRAIGIFSFVILIFVAGVAYANKSKILYIGKKVSRYVFGSTIVKMKPKIPTCAFQKKVLPKISKDDYTKHREAGKKLPDMVWIENDSIQNEFIRCGISNHDVAFAGL